MQYELPDNHNLSQQVVEYLVFRDSDSPALTDIQHSCLSAGIGHERSLLVVSPTSTGKTQIAVWAIANGIETGANTVYLVTHRALAQQKFLDFQNLLTDSFLDGDRSNVVLATGDAVIDGNEQSPADPLRAPLLVATYEKYLAMLSASGVPTSMANTVIVCDEIQLIGDENRGQNVEILLTLLKSAGWRQFVGLSAVLDQKDATDLAGWLDVDLIRQTNREKHLQYEYWGDGGVLTVNSANPEDVTEVGQPAGVDAETLQILRHLENQDPPPLPVIVFCMRKQDVYDLAEADLAYREGSNGPQLPLDLGPIPETSANSFLSRALSHRIAIHSADLTEEERKIVEQGLIERRVDVVYATTTLAAGVNFPLGAAVFHQWSRWNPDIRAYIPIATSEFHNMAGRVGRMGTDHAGGRVIFSATKGMPRQAHLDYLDLDKLVSIKCRIGPESFEQLGLQLIASGLCDTRGSVEELIKSSFSGLRELEENPQRLASWSALIDAALSTLIGYGMVFELSDGRLVSTPVGKATGYSGFKPLSVVALLNYYIEKAPILENLIEDATNSANLTRFAYLVFAASYSTPEFRPRGGTKPSRYLPWPFKDFYFDAADYQQDLMEPAWHADTHPTTAAELTKQWVDGGKLADLETAHGALSAGMLLEMYRNLGWLIQGTTLILSAASDSRTPDNLRPDRLKGNPEAVVSLRKLPRAISRLGLRVSAGLPDDMLWMQSLNAPDEAFTLTRDEILGLRARGMTTPQQVMLGNPESDQVRVEVFQRVVHHSFCNFPVA